MQRKFLCPPAGRYVEPVPEIAVESLGGREFRVRVVEAGRETIHFVGISADFPAAIGVPDIALVTLVERSFEFLLEREAAASILERFTLDEICRYFPEYTGEIAHRLP
jgi:hypothetical protein